MGTLKDGFIDYSAVGFTLSRLHDKNAIEVEPFDCGLDCKFKRICETDKRYDVKRIGKMILPRQCPLYAEKQMELWSKEQGK